MVPDDSSRAGAADLSGCTPVLLPPPVSDLLTDPHGGNGGQSTNWNRLPSPPTAYAWNAGPCWPVQPPANQLLWTQRRRQPLLMAPTFALRFDVLHADN